MQNILKGLDGVFIYIDDILIFGKTSGEHCTNLLNVLKRPYTNNVELNFDKCEFFKEEIILLGYLISHNKMKIIKDSMKLNIKKLIPKTKKQLQKIIGYLNWFGNIVSLFSQKISPLINMLKEKKLQRNKEKHDVVNRSFDEIVNFSYLVCPDYKKKLYLSCDASNIGAERTLYQDSGVIGYFSKRLSPTEERYTIVERRFLQL